MKNCCLFIENIFENGWWGMPGIPVFHSLGTVNLFFYTKRQNQKGDRGRGHGTMPSSINTFLTRRKRIIVMN